MTLTAHTIFFISLILSIAGAVVVIVLANRIKQQLKVLDAIREDIDSSEQYLETLGEMTKSKQEELDQTKVEINILNAEYAENKKQIEDLTSRFNDCKDTYESLEADIERLGFYVTAAAALADGSEIELDDTYIKEVPFLGESVAALPIKNNVYKSLIKAHIYRICDLVDANQDLLIKLSGLGIKTLSGIINKMVSNGCYFGMSYVCLNGKYFTNCKTIPDQA